MKTFGQKPEKFWWTQSPNSMLYALREFSAVLITIWAVYTVALLVFPEFFKPAVKIIIETLGFTGAIIHSLTWFTVMPKLLPAQLSHVANVIIYLLQIIILIIVSLLIFLWI